MIRKVKDFFVSLTFWVTALMLVIPTLFTVGPTLEQYISPVIINGKFIVERHDNYVTWVQAINKERDCSFLDARYYASFDPIDSSFDETQKIPLIVENLPFETQVGTFTTSYEPGQHIIGPFQTLLPEYITENAPEHMSVIGVLRYNCNLPWQTKAILGPIDVPITDTMYGLIKGLSKTVVNPSLLNKKGQ